MLLGRRRARHQRMADAHEARGEAKRERGRRSVCQWRAVRSTLVACRLPTQEPEFWKGPSRAFQKRHGLEVLRRRFAMRTSPCAHAFAPTDVGCLPPSLSLCRARARRWTTTLSGRPSRSRHSRPRWTRRAPTHATSTTPTRPTCTSSASWRRRPPPLEGEHRRARCAVEHCTRETGCLAVNCRPCMPAGA